MIFSVDCKIAWGTWQTCSTFCGPGVQKATQFIRDHPLNGGKSCPARDVKFKDCQNKRCSTGIIIY